MSPETKNMEEFKQEVRDDLRELTRNVSKLTEAVGSMATTLAVSEEQKKQQERINESQWLEINQLKKDVGEIKIERATEKPAREFLSKNLPILAFLVTLASVVMASLGAKYGSSIFGG